MTDDMLELRAKLAHDTIVSFIRDFWHQTTFFPKALPDFKCIIANTIAVAVQDERERCAKVAQDYCRENLHTTVGEGTRIAAAIRKDSNDPS